MTPRAKPANSMSRQHKNAKPYVVLSASQVDKAKRKKPQKNSTPVIIPMPHKISMGLKADIIIHLRFTRTKQIRPSATTHP